MSTSMRIEVESKQSSTGGRAVSYPDSASGPGYTISTRPTDPGQLQQGYRDAMAKQRNERETAERLAAREKADRKAADRQERDEAWLARQESRDQKRQEAEQSRREKQQERDEAWLARQESRDQKRQEAEQSRREKQQERDEAWLARQEAKLQKQQEAEAAREAKRQESAAAKAARQQEKDENYYERQQKRDQAARNAIDPQYLANQMMQQNQLRQAVQQQAIMSQLGISPGSAMGKIANVLGSVNNAMSSFQMSLGASTKLLGGLGFIVGTVHAAYKHAIDTLMQESRRVARFSPELRMQEVRNTMREMRTDRRIASEYGAQMAAVSDRESRQEAANRVIGVKVASIMEKGFGWMEEMYTQVLEFIAGTGTVNKESVEYLKKITKLNERQLDEMGISKRDQQDIGDAVKQAEKLLNTLGMDGLADNDPVKDWIKDGKDNGNWILDRNAENPGIIPNTLPRGWNDV